jgi:hypothetical protein
MTEDTTATHLTDDALDRLTTALTAYTAMLEKATTGGGGGTPPAPPATPAPTAAQVEGLDAAFRYRLLRTLMSATGVEEVTGRVERRNRALEVTAHPAGTTVTHLQLVGDPVDDDSPGPRVQGVVPLSSGRVSAKTLRQAGIDVDGAFDDLRLLAGPAGPVVAVAPPLSVPADSHPDTH